jgi:hypothetical protein
MKKTSTIAAALVLLCAGLQSANAGLLGMPLNLKAAIEQADLDRSPAIFQQQFFYTGDVITDALLVSSC